MRLHLLKIFITHVLELFPFVDECLTAIQFGKNLELNTNRPSLKRKSDNDF